MPKDYGAKQTDKELAQLERRLATLYAESKAELEEAIDNYYNGWYEQVGDKTVYHAGLLQRKEVELEAFKEGKYHDPSGRYSDEEMFARWWWAQEGRGKELEKMRDDMARKMTETNQRAVAMINDKTPTIYALNANWEAYKIQVVRKNDSGKWIRENARRDFDNGTTLNVAFDLVKETTVKELVENKNHSEFRVNSINPKRDYDWNYDQIQKALLAGVMMGDSPYDIAKRYLTVMHRNRTASIRNARTSVTSAQNAGCQHTYERAVEKGIPIKKQWMATMDKRTRESHILANGQIVDVKDKFKVGECKMEYPAHPDGNPEEVYNCRCTMVTVDPAVLNVNGDPYDVAGFKKWVKENRKDITYPEDEQQKENENEKEQFVPANTIEDAKEFAKQFVSDYQTKYSGIVDYGGADLETANAINKALFEAFRDYDVPKLDTIQKINFREKIFKGKTMDACYRWGKRDLYYNQNYYKNEKLLNKHIKEADDLLAQVLGGIDKLLQTPKYQSGIQHEYMIALKNTGAQCVAQMVDRSKWAEVTFTHEIGHFLDDTVFRKYMKETGFNLKESMNKYGGNISGYAVSDNMEYVAESYAMFKYGMIEKLDPKLIEVFKGAMRK